MSINRVVESGNLTRDSNLRMTKSGTAILDFSIAVNDRRRNSQTGEWEDYANFFDCVMFGKRAEALFGLLTKGTKVTVEGKLRWSQWEKDGHKLSKVDIVVEEIEFMSAKKDAAPKNAPSAADEGGYGAYDDAGLYDEVPV